MRRALRIPREKNNTSASGRLRTTGTPTRAAIAIAAAATIGVANQTNRGGSFIDSTIHALSAMRRASSPMGMPG